MRTSCPAPPRGAAPSGGRATIRRRRPRRPSPRRPSAPGARSSTLGRGEEARRMSLGTTAIHIGQDELPFVEIGGGNKLKVLQVKRGEGLWIIENIFMAGYEVQTHRHTGPVWGYTRSGAWKYKEYDYVNRAGSFLYEPANSVHTLHCIEDGTKVF